jgi:hypothetical protein
MHDVMSSAQDAVSSSNAGASASTCRKGCCESSSTPLQQSLSSLKLCLSWCQGEFKTPINLSSNTSLHTALGLLLLFSNLMILQPQYRHCMQGTSSASQQLR